MPSRGSPLAVRDRDAFRVRKGKTVASEARFGGDVDQSSGPVNLDKLRASVWGEVLNVHIQSAQAIRSYSRSDALAAAAV